MRGRRFGKLRFPRRVKNPLFELRCTERIYAFRNAKNTTPNTMIATAQNEGECST